MEVNNFIILGAGVTGLTLGYELSKKGNNVSNPKSVAPKPNETKTTGNTQQINVPVENKSVIKLIKILIFKVFF